jgi:hypothetical protein
VGIFNFFAVAIGVDIGNKTDTRCGCRLDGCCTRRGDDGGRLRVVSCESNFPHEPVHADSGVLLEISLLFSSDEGSLIHIVYQVKAEEDDTANDHGNQGLYKAKPRLALPIDAVITPFSHAGPHT